MFLVLSCRCLCPILWSQVLTLEWRCSWSYTNRWCSNYIWVINDIIAYEGASYNGVLTVLMYLQKTFNRSRVKIFLYLTEVSGYMHGHLKLDVKNPIKLFWLCYVVLFLNFDAGGVNPPLERLQTFISCSVNIIESDDPMTEGDRAATSLVAGEYWVAWPRRFNSLWPSDVLWLHRSGSTLAQVMARYLTAPSHYLKQCWFFLLVRFCGIHLRANSQW